MNGYSIIDVTGAVTRRSAPSGGTHYQYDEQYTLIQVTDPKSQVTGYTYAAAGRPTQETVAERTTDYNDDKGAALWTPKSSTSGAISSRLFRSRKNANAAPEIASGAALAG